MTISDLPSAHLDQTSRILLQLNVPIHRIGRYQLLIGIPRYAQNPMQSLSKDLYPYISRHCENVSLQAVERSIRDVILYAWKNGDREIWTVYFPDLTRPPSNKRFIATLAEQLK